jgi:hypothetical protein
MSRPREFTTGTTSILLSLAGQGTSLVDAFHEANPRSMRVVENGHVRLLQRVAENGKRKVRPSVDDRRNARAARGIVFVRSEVHIARIQRKRVRSEDERHLDLGIARVGVEAVAVICGLCRAGNLGAWARRALASLTAKRWAHQCVDGSREASGAVDE